MQRMPMQRMPMQRMPMQRMPMQRMPMQRMPMQRMPMQRMPMQRMNGIDPMFIYSDTAATPMEVAYACIFDPSTAGGGYSFERVRQLLAERVPGLPPFRRRLMTVPLGLDHPRWVDDPDFDLDNHLFREALPDPGGQAEFTEMVARVMGRQLGADQPPWEMHVVEGLAGGRIGLIAKVHHSVIDGVAGATLMAQLLDLSAEGRPVTTVATPWVPPALPSGGRLMADALPNLLTSPLRAWRAAREVGQTAVRLLRCALGDDRTPVSIPLGAPQAFDTAVGVGRAVAFGQLALADVRAAREAFGVTINDVVLSMCSGALRQHLAEHDCPAEGPLVAIVPVSVRGAPQDDAIGNQLSAMFVALANEVDGPRERLAAIAQTCTCTKTQERTVGFGPMASAISDAVPPALARPAVRMGVQLGAVRRLRAGNLMVSNVPGPDVPLYFAGMRMTAVHPLGPVVDGVALNITVQSYEDSLFVGINAGQSVLPDLPGLVQAMAAELEQLVAAIPPAAHRVTPKSPRPRPTPKVPAAAHAIRRPARLAPVQPPRVA
jgi:diacylglycerol O-acyltransferase